MLPMLFTCALFWALKVSTPKVKIEVIILLMCFNLYTKDKPFGDKTIIFLNTTNHSKMLLQIAHTFVHKLG
jgi:hypothetical protein